jgi:hypothetical protein
MMINRLISSCFSSYNPDRLSKKFVRNAIIFLNSFITCTLLLYCLSINNFLCVDSYTLADVYQPKKSRIKLVSPQPGPSPLVSPQPSPSPLVSPQPSPSPLVSPQPSPSPLVSPQPSPSQQENPPNNLFYYIESLAKIISLSLLIHFVYLALVKLALSSRSQDALGGLIAKFFNVWLDAVARRAKAWQYGLIILIHSLPASLITILIWQNLTFHIFVINSIITFTTFIVWIAKR